MTKQELFKKVCKGDRFYRDQHKRCYALVNIEDHKEVMIIDSREYRDLIEFRLYQQLQAENQTLSSKLVGKLVEIAKLEAKYNGKQKPLCKRISECDGYFYYDMTNDDWGVIKITPDKWEYCHTSKTLFERCQTQTLQVMPVQNGDINKLDKYLKNVPAHQRLLVKVHIIACLVPNISHAPLIIQSEKGSGKTTLTQMMKNIVDPGSKYPLQLNTNELVLNLHSNYLANFDNLSHISSGISDMFCRAVTGATDNKRKLHTDTELIIMEYKNCLLLNGINLGMLKDDLLDRSILIALEKLSPQELMSDTEYMENFNKDLPDILGGIFTVLSKAMGIYAPACSQGSFRLIDYANWGYAIAEAIDGNGQEYINALNRNRIDKNQELFASNALCLAVREFMRDKNHWKGQPGTLLGFLDRIAYEKRLGKNEKHWPSSAISLSHQLERIKSILSEEGIIVEGGKHTNKGSTIIITKA